MARQTAYLIVFAVTMAMIGVAVLIDAGMMQWCHANGRGSYTFSFKCSSVWKTPVP